MRPAVGADNSGRVIPSTLIARAKPWLLESGLYRPARYVYLHLLHRDGLRTLKRQAQFFAAFVSTEDLCFDIGANHGHKSEALLRVGARGVAVEPLPACAAELRHRLGGTAGVQGVERAGGDRQGTGRR